MARQVPFTEHEAALLLDAYLTTIEGTASRSEAIRTCSDGLRRMAINNGMIIDDVYRNVNGITFQMASMESAYQGRTIMQAATRLFSSMVEMYHNNRRQYDEILKEARVMASTDKKNHESAEKPQGDTQEYRIIDFSNIGSLEYTKPVSLKYFNTEKPEKSWRVLYIDFCTFALADYPDDFEAMKRECLSGKTAMWLVNEENIAPLKSAKDIGSGFYIETNRSALVFVKNIRRIMDYCEMDYENVIIQYSAPASQKNPGNFEVKSLQISSKAQERSYHREDKENFYQWMLNHEKMAEATCRGYVSSVKSAEKYASEHGIDFIHLYGVELSVAKESADKLFSDAGFVKFNEVQHNRLRAAITKLLLFLGDDDWSPSTGRVQVKRENEYSPEKLRLYADVLKEYFPKGYRLDSNLEMKKFRGYFEEANGESLEEETDIIKKIFKSAALFTTREFICRRTCWMTRCIVDSLNTLRSASQMGKPQFILKPFSVSFQKNFWITTCTMQTC